MRSIYKLQDRGGSLALYHLIVYNLGGLYDIPESANFPVTIYLENTGGPMAKIFDQVFHIIGDKYTLIKQLPVGEEYEIVPIFGETCEKNGVSDHPDVIFPFLRELFLSRISLGTSNMPKRFFIGRKQSVITGNTYLTSPQRSILNEEAFIENLKKYNIACIYLEDYAFEDKIRLFNAAELIISTNSSALTCLLWCNTSVKVVEMSYNAMHTAIGLHYRLICKILGLTYIRYNNIEPDENDNFIVDDDSDIYEYLSRA